MGTKARQRSPSKIALAKEKKPTATTVEHGPAPLTKHPRQKKKKRSKRRRNKSRLHLTVQGRSCSIHGLASKGLPPESQESTIKFCYCSVNSGNALSKTDKLGESHTAKLETKNKNTFGKESTGHSEKPKNTSIITENKRRLKYANVVEKRKFQAVSEYQFIYPGKSAFHSNPEINTNQNLRSIYQGKADPKPPRTTHLSVRMPRCQWEMRTALRGNVNAEARCPIGSDFVSSARPRNPAQGVTSLTYKTKLVLVNEDQTPAENMPSVHAVNPYFPQLRHLSISQKPGPLTEAFQRSKHNAAKKVGWVEQQQTEDAWSRPMGLPAKLGNSPRLRPVSAKEHYEKALDQPFGRKRNQNELSEKGTAAHNRPAVGADGKAAIVQTKSALVIPAISEYPSSENLAITGVPSGWKTATQFLVEKEGPKEIKSYGSQEEVGQGSFPAVSGSPTEEPSKAGT